MSDCNSNIIRYIGRIRERTMRVIAEIPESKYNWRPVDNAFSFAEILVHLSNIEYQMYCQTIQNKPNIYSGHQINEMNSNSVLNHLDHSHQNSMKVFSSFSDKELNEKCNTPTGIKITRWKWIRAMIEHETHHRGQIFTYLKIINIPTSPIFGLTSEELNISY